MLSASVHQPDVPIPQVILLGSLDIGENFQRYLEEQLENPPFLPLLEDVPGEVLARGIQEASVPNS